MNSLERIRNTIQFKKTDRCPAIPQILSHAASMANVPLKEYLQNGELLADCQLKAHEKYHHDAVFLFMDAGMESEAFGSQLFYPENDYPRIIKYAISEQNEIDKLRLPNVETDGRLAEFMKAARILLHELKGNTPIIPLLTGPITLLSQVTGLEKTLYLAIDSPDVFQTLLNAISDFIIDFGLHLINAGIEFLVLFEPVATPEIVPAQFFREFLLSPLKKIIDQFKETGEIVSGLNITGETDSILPYYEKIGVQIATMDYDVNPFKASQTIQNSCLIGNIKPLSFVEENSDYIYNRAIRLLKIFKERGGFILSSGCEIPIMAKPENIMAMMDAVSEFGW